MAVVAVIDSSRGFPKKENLLDDSDDPKEGDGPKKGNLNDSDAPFT